jgi:hypothetical protein
VLDKEAKPQIPRVRYGVLAQLREDVVFPEVGRAMRTAFVQFTDRFAGLVGQVVIDSELAPRLQNGDSVALADHGVNANPRYIVTKHVSVR